MEIWTVCYKNASMFHFHLVLFKSVDVHFHLSVYPSCLHIVMHVTVTSESNPEYENKTKHFPNYLLN